MLTKRGSIVGVGVGAFVGQGVALGSGVAVNTALGPLFGGSVGVGEVSATVVFCFVQAVRSKRLPTIRAMMRFIGSP